MIANDHALLQHFNLSQNRFLHTLEITAESIDHAGDSAPDFFKTVLSSVTFPGLLDVVIIYGDFNFNSPHRKWCDSEPIRSRHNPEWIRELYTKYHKRQLRVLRKMHSVRDFRLVLCADIPNDIAEHIIVETPECIAKAERVKEGLDYLCRPLIIFERRILRTRPTDYHVGYQRGWPIPASAL